MTEWIDALLSSHTLKEASIFATPETAEVFKNVDQEILQLNGIVLMWAKMQYQSRVKKK